MLYACTGSVVGANAAGAMSGCYMVSTNASASAQPIYGGPQLTPMFRWRPGNLGARQVAGRFTRSVSRLTDNKRPMAVQKPSFVDPVQRDVHRSGHQEPHFLVGF